MIEEVLKDASLRVFSVDRDCYVVFIGTDKASRRAFLRIGHSALLPEEAHNHIEGLVYTNDLLGNVVAEQEWLLGLSDRERPYFTGVPDVLKRHKNFFELKKVFRTKYQSLRQSTIPEKSGAFLDYTGLDQVEIFLNQECIFSLRKRAASDSHFSQRNERIARLISQYNSAYGAATLPSSGFFVVGSALYLYDHGQIFTINPPADCYEQLAKHGFDSRLISGGLHTKPDHSFLSLMMNKALKRPPAKWRFYHPDGRVQGRIDVERFLNFAQKKLAHDMVTGSLEVPFSAFKLIHGADSRKMRSANSKETSTYLKYALRLNEHCQCAVDTEKRIWRVVNDNKSWQGDLIPNIPYSFSISQPLTEEALARRYLPNKFQNGTHQITRSETLLLNSCLQVVNAQTLKKLQTNYRQIRRAGRQVKRSAQFLTLYALRNVRTLLNLKCITYAKDSARLSLVKKTLKQIDNIIDRLSQPSPYTLYLPAQAVIHLTTSGSYVQFIDYTWNRDYHHMTHELDIQQQISAIIDVAGEEFYQSERERFFHLLADLNGENEELQSLAKGSLDNEKQQAMERESQNKPSVTKKPINTHSARKVGVIILIAIAVGALVLALVFNIDIRRGSGQDVAQDTDNSVTTIIQDADEPTDQNTPDADTRADQDQSSGEQSALQDTIEDSPASDAEGVSAVAPEVLKERIANSTLDESSFNSLINQRATSLSGVYLTVQGPFGNIEVTIAEIIRVVNIIARQSGFREIGVDDVTAGDDPNLIYPFNQLSLPPRNEKYRIIEDDSIWLVAVSLIESQIKDFSSQLIEINGVIENERIDPEIEKNSSRLS